MDNILDNYQPDNRMFRNLVLIVLALVSGIFYAAYRLRYQGYLHWYDWSIISIPIAALSLSAARDIEKKKQR